MGVNAFDSNDYFVRIPYVTVGEKRVAVAMSNPDTITDVGRVVAIEPGDISPDEEAYDNANPDDVIEDDDTFDGGGSEDGADNSNHGCGTDTFFDWGCTRDGEQVTPLLISILNWLAVGVTIAVTAGVVYGAVMYTSSSGRSEQAKKAIGIIRNAIIALVLYFAMWAVLNFLVPGGLFN
jgi:hypothetical protein